MKIFMPATGMASLYITYINKDTYLHYVTLQCLTLLLEKKYLQNANIFIDKLERQLISDAVMKPHCVAQMPAQKGYFSPKH